jgi:hypothetical protein
MLQVILIGIGAGLAAALLFLAPISGSALAFPLFVLTGLPIAIAGLGWGVSAGAIALAAGSVVTAFMLGAILAAAVFALAFAAPIVWVTRLAGLSRAIDTNDPQRGVEWYPLGRILLHVVLAVAISLSVTGFLTGYDPVLIAREATAAILEFMASPQSTELSPPSPESIQPFVDLYVAILPFTVAVFMVAVIVFNVWLGGIIARSSGRLARPPEQLWTVAPPNEIAIGFAVAIGLAFVLPDPLAHVAAVFAGAFGCGLALVGLAVLHAVTVGVAGRGILLIVSYALILISGLPLILFAALGAAENFLHLRARRLGGAPPT